MRFRNIVTGAIIEAPSMLGGRWERIDVDKAPTKEPVASLPVSEKAEEVKPVKKPRTRKTKK